MKVKGVVAIFLVLGLTYQSEGAYLIGIQKTPDGHKNPSIGLVKGAKQCGGPGEFVAFYVQGCSADSTCKVQVGPPIIGEIDFKPSVDMAQVKVKISASELDGSGAEVLFNSVLNPSAVTKGETNTLTMYGQLPAKFIGKKLKRTYEFLSPADDAVQVCVEAEMEYYA